MSKHWKPQALSELARYVNGFAFKPHHWVKEGLPIIRIEQLNNPSGGYDFCDTAVPADNVVDDGDLIFSWSATLKVALWRHGRAALNQHLFKVLPNASTDKGFLFQVLDHNMDALSGGSHGSTMKHIKRSELDKYIVKVPEYGEQVLLARILRALDIQIEATVALIAKQERVRAGLMQDLFTRGVDEHGQLRPPRDQAPHLYHQTELGWLPLGWAVRSVDDATESVIDGPFGSNLKSEHYVDEPGVRVIRLQNIQTGIYDNRDSVYVSDHHAQFLAKFSVLPGDVLIASLGDDRYQAGRACCYPSGLGPAINKADCFRVRPDKVEAISKFLMLTFNSERMRLESVKLIQGVTRQRINVGNFKKLLIALPGLAEQRAFALAYEMSSAPIDKLNTELKEVVRLKAGLMQDLLTGKVSVRPLLERAAV